jgi:hypothetical protein
MKLFTLVVAVLTLTQPVFSQGMFGAEAGFGKATVSKSYLTPAIEGYYFRKLSRTFYFGVTASYERYSFLDKYSGSAVTPANDPIISIRQKSGYVFLSPTIDVGLGYRKYIHVRTSFGAGLLANGRQLTNVSLPYVAPPPRYTGYDTITQYTSYNIPVLVSRYTLGLTERIPTDGYWNIVVSQEYCYIPTNLNNYGPNLKTNYFALTVGIMHKYPMAFVEY